MDLKEIDLKLQKLRKFANFVITPLCLALIVVYFLQKRMTLWVTILAVLVVLTYIPYGFIMLHYLRLRRKMQKHIK